MDLRDFLHGIVEHILKNGVQYGKWNIKKSKNLKAKEEMKSPLFYTAMVEGEKKQQAK
ncbi:hypothetical protein [Priestia megaterium]|uniref:hypothetical protein n=1 Tax=Priestia megaterium TaxID=1404 RepID=UPI003100DE6D